MEEPRKPKYFEDEIAERLRDLIHGDKVIVKDDLCEKSYFCRQTMRDDDGVYWTYRRFETGRGAIVNDIERRLYKAANEGCELFVEHDGMIEIF